VLFTTPKAANEHLVTDAQIAQAQADGKVMEVPAPKPDVQLRLRIRRGLEPGDADRRLTSRGDAPQIGSGRASLRRALPDTARVSIQHERSPLTASRAPIRQTSGVCGFGLAEKDIPEGGPECLRLPRGPVSALHPRATTRMAPGAVV
jgi:hypothetical protein